MSQIRFFLASFFLLPGCGGTTLRSDAVRDHDATPGDDAAAAGSGATSVPADASQDRGGAVGAERPSNDAGSNRGAAGASNDAGSNRGAGGASNDAGASTPPDHGDADAIAPIVAQVDSQGLPVATCREGKLYAPLEHGADSNSIPIELELTMSGPDQPEWTRTQNLMELVKLTPPLSETYVRGPASATCEQGRAWLGMGSTLLDSAPKGGTAIWTERTPSAASCAAVGQSACHPHGAVGVSWDCGALPFGDGGQIEPGVYALVGYVRYEGTSYPALGAYIVQTLYLTADGAFVVSYDDNNFGYAGSSRYSTSANRLVFTEDCGSQPAMYRAFPATATYTASGRTLELFDAARNVRSTFVRMD